MNHNIREFNLHLCAEFTELGLNLGFYMPILRKSLLGPLLFSSSAFDQTLRPKLSQTLLALQGKRNPEEEILQVEEAKSSAFLDKIGNTIKNVILNTPIVNLHSKFISLSNKKTLPFFLQGGDKNIFVLRKDIYMTLARKIVGKKAPLKNPLFYSNGSFF